MASLIRRKPTNAFRETLKPIDRQQIDALIAAVVEAYASEQEAIILKTSYLTQFADDFPKGVLKRKEGLFDYRQVKARRLLKWLNDHGYFETTALELRGLLIAHGLKYKEMLNP